MVVVLVVKRKRYSLRNAHIRSCPHYATTMSTGTVVVFVVVIAKVVLLVVKRKRCSL